MSLEFAAEVAQPKSFFSTSATFSPRDAASYATAAPVIPPPMMTISNSSPLWLSMKRSIAYLLFAPRAP